MGATTSAVDRLRTAGPCQRLRPTDPGAGRRYEAMVRARATDDLSARMWTDGLVSGELHPSRGEEAAVVGVVDHLRDGDGAVPRIVARPAAIVARRFPSGAAPRFRCYYAAGRGGGLVGSVARCVKSR